MNATTFSVNQRPREIGIRGALGAQPGQRAARIDPMGALRGE